MKNSSQIIKFINITDDTIKYSKRLDMNGIHDVLAAELVQVGVWLLANRLCLNRDKTSYMFVTNGIFAVKQLALSGKII